MKLDFDNLPDRIEVESIINSLDSEETSELILIGRRRMLDEKREQTEGEIQAGMMLVRRLRALRETKARTPASQKAKAKVVAAPSLESLL